MPGRYWDHRTCRWEGGDDPAGPPPVWAWPRPVEQQVQVPSQATVEQEEPAPDLAAPV